jgi:hypothetical protein
VIKELIKSAQEVIIWGQSGKISPSFYNFIPSLDVFVRHLKNPPSLFASVLIGGSYLLSLRCVHQRLPSPFRLAFPFLIRVHLPHPRLPSLSLLIFLIRGCLPPGSPNLFDSRRRSSYNAKKDKELT